MVLGAELVLGLLCFGGSVYLMCMYLSKFPTKKEKQICSERIGQLGETT